MRRAYPLVCLLVSLTLGASLPASARATPPPYQTGIMHWGATTGGLGSWSLHGARLADDGALQLDRATASVSMDPTLVSGVRMGEALSPALPTAFAFTEAIGSWNADTPPGTWIETRLRAQIGDRWTAWYSLGVWAADESVIRRHSVRGQNDADGAVAIDTLRLHAPDGPATALQLSVRFFSSTQTTPTLRAAAVAYSTTPVKPDTLAPGDPTRWNQVLPVPSCSQMVYPDGGNVWCSPTATSMTLAYWRNDSGPCEPRVRAAVAGVYDWSYGEHGNWSFNTAYAATHGLEGYVVRMTSLARAERWIAIGVPVVISLAWGAGELTGAPVTASSGHLIVLVGFDQNGNPVVNDPAAASDGTVRRTYQRAELESLWLAASGGAAYVIYPVGYPGAVLD